VADRLDLPADYVTAAPAAAPGPGAAAGGAAALARSGARSSGRGGAPSSPGAVALAAERAFLAMCLASGDEGREALEALSDEHLSSELTRRARERLLRGFDDPLAELPEDDPALAALVTGLAAAAEEQAEASAPVLRMSFLQLELRRIERELRRAAERSDRSRQDELAGARQDVRREMDTVMGQTA
jgi:hypothetical protein